MADDERVARTVYPTRTVPGFPSRCPTGGLRCARRTVASVDPTGAVVRAVSGAPLLAPVVTAAVVTAAAAAVVSGVAAASR